MTKLTPTRRPTHSTSALVRDVRGANLVEYIILVGVVALIALAGFKVFGEKVDAKVKRQSSTVSGI